MFYKKWYGIIPTVVFLICSWSQSLLGADMAIKRIVSMSINPDRLVTHRNDISKTITWMLPFVDHVVIALPEKFRDEIPYTEVAQIAALEHLEAICQEKWVLLREEYDIGPIMKLLPAATWAHQQGFDPKHTILITLDDDSMFGIQTSPDTFKKWIEAGTQTALQGKVGCGYPTTAESYGLSLDIVSPHVGRKKSVLFDFVIGASGVFYPLTKLTEERLPFLREWIAISTNTKFSDDLVISFFLYFFQVEISHLPGVTVTNYEDRDDQLALMSMGTEGKLGNGFVRNTRYRDPEDEKKRYGLALTAMNRHLRKLSFSPKSSSK